MTTRRQRLKTAAVTKVAARSYRSALRLYQRLAELEPTEPDWAHRLGELARRLGDIPAALSAFEKARSLYAVRGLERKAEALDAVIHRLRGGEQLTKPT